MFFEQVFIHDYQSETAATSDWDYEHGVSFESYTPAAVRDYEDGQRTRDFSDKISPQSPSSSAITHKETEKPAITYNENDFVDFTESNVRVDGALLF